VNNPHRQPYTEIYIHVRILPGTGIILNVMFDDGLVLLNIHKDEKRGKKKKEEKQSE
jgi:hypothetical protein